MKKVVLDLGCGRGGWSKPFLARGVECFGVDTVNHDYPGYLVLCDLLKFSARAFEGRVRIVVASPPCEEYSRHSMPWTRAKNPPQPNLELWRACLRIAEECGAPLILENVRAAQGWWGKAVAHYGPFYLWGGRSCFVAVRRLETKRKFRIKATRGARRDSFRSGELHRRCLRGINAHVSVD